MSLYAVYVTEPFEELFYSLDNSEQKWIEKIKQKLEENPTGKILNFSWFREKKYLNKRLYYLIDENRRKVLLVAFTSKKDQQQTIDFIRANMNELLEYLRRL